MIQCVIITLHYMFYSYAMTNVFDESESMVYLSSGQKNKKCFSWWRVSGRRDVLVQGLQHFRWKCPTRVETGVVVIEKHAKTFLCQGLSKGPPVALLLLALQHLHLAPGPHIQLHHWGIRISASHPGVHTFNTILEVKPSLVFCWWLYPSFWHWWSRLFLLFLFVRFDNFTTLQMMFCVFKEANI